MIKGFKIAMNVTAYREYIIKKYFFEDSMERNNQMNQAYGYVAVLHAVPDAPNVDVYANDNLIASNLAYGTYTDYVRVPATTYQVTIYATGTNTNPVVSKMLTVGRNEMITVAAVGTLDTIDLLAIEDANTPEVPDRALVRFAHLSPNAPAVDITLTDGTLIFNNVSFKQVTNYVPVSQMDYTLQVRLAGTDTIVLTVPDVDVRNNNYYTIYAIGLVGEEPALEALFVHDGVNQ